MTRNVLIGVFVVGALLVVGGVFAYESIVNDPPEFLVELATKNTPPPPLPQGALAPFEAPEGFVATIFSREVPNARVMALDPRGTLVVSQTKEGKVSILPDADQDGTADETRTIIDGLNRPHGILFDCESESDCVLYVAETNALKSYRYESDAQSAEYIETLTALPEGGGGHYTRTLLKHPDRDTILVSVGSSCNVCDESDPERATVLEVDPASKEVRIFATGLRNTVFLAEHPRTGEVWGTDNGRDLIGDDIPPDEVNIITEGSSYGWPICYGNKIHDTAFDKKQYIRNPCEDSTAPHIELQAHSAALGLDFIPENGWPEEMQGDLLIAYHGSWNRSEPTGYKVVRFDLDSRGQMTGGPHDFLAGFLEGSSDTDDALGRPAGVLVESNGAVYISDDHAGAIYRILPEAQN